MSSAGRMEVVYLFSVFECTRLITLHLQAVHVAVDESLLHKK